MSIEILERKKIDSKCRTLDMHAEHRHSLFGNGGANIDVLNRVVTGNHVVEIGCGVFGGIAHEVLRAGCTSYTGVDLTTGHGKLVHGFREFQYEIDFLDDKKFHKVDISSHIVSDSRVTYVFGIDFLTYFRTLSSESVVTVSTGFFHDYLITPKNEGVDYLDEGILEMSRATKIGEYVGFHQFMLDANEQTWTPAGFLRPYLSKYGLSCKPSIERYTRDEFWVLSKGK